MTIAPGDRLPDATLLRIGGDGPESVQLSELTTGKTIVLFGLPGAYTGTCTSAHVPSFIRVMDDLKTKGVDAVICVAVNDPFVMAAWGEATGATAAGIHLLADPAAEFTKAMGQNFTAPPVGFYDRSKRYALVAKDGEVTLLNLDENPGTCEMSAGETIRDAL